MIGKQIKGSGFGGLLKYLEDKVNKGVGERLETNMLGSSTDELTKEFRLISSMKPNLKKVVYHCSLNIAPGEVLTNQQFTKIAQDYLDEMGFGNSQYIIYRHSDREHPHIHIVANRVSLDGAVVSDKWDYKRSEQILRTVEKEYNLMNVIDSKDALKTTLKKSEVGKFRRTGEIPVKKQLQIILDSSLKTVSSLHELQEYMIRNGANVELSYNEQGKPFGISFELDGCCFKGSSLGKSYSYGNISKQIKLNNERDRRTSEKKSTRENKIVGRTSGATSESKYFEYSRTYGSFITNKKDDDKVNVRSSGFISINSKQSDKFGKYDQESGSIARENVSSKGKTKGGKFQYWSKNDSVNNLNRNNFSGSNFSIPGSSINKGDEDEEELRNSKRYGDTSMNI
ncbi:relaxase/mobilization nuclease domain-containing protein [Plebeiibacterium sediminum]|uniref:Relaxase/mobilization nuclease domain-containing protein n=1 Tax=Plebeiibacterium sediminum TaxID=2992112 RepID=A0AAE3M4Z1_9BACT|nr:relaxase/mobilization nuclease domain-containing protein [Plebeiobacterium sediminum]MCW3787219.1 relaxase/mobilization nuclease domain-containing protein [Plebeiobacterium sediminum]